MASLSPAFQALESLNTAQVRFLNSLRKAELHAHLNGSIPIEVLQEMARNADHEQETSEVVKAGLQKLEEGVVLDEFQDFFALFPAIYHLTSTPATIAIATKSVLDLFLSPSSNSSCDYLELRTTPRANPKTGLTRRSYLDAVLGEIDTWNENAGQKVCSLIVSLDCRMTPEDAEEIVGLVKDLKEEGRNVCALDLCGDPSLSSLIPLIAPMKLSPVPLTIHLAELPNYSPSEALRILQELKPSRLGHATFLDEEGKKFVLDNKIAIEVCLSSNALTKTTPSLEESHLHYYLDKGHPVSINTDDPLPFRTTLLAEYALLLAAPPFGLGMTEEEVKVVAQGSWESRFV